MTETTTRRAWPPTWPELDPGNGREWNRGIERQRAGSEVADALMDVAERYRLTFADVVALLGMELAKWAKHHRRATR